MKLQRVIGVFGALFIGLYKAGAWIVLSLLLFVGLRQLQKLVEFRGNSQGFLGILPAHQHSR